MGDEHPALDETDRQLHRKLGADLFNAVWDLLEKPDRTPEDDETMLHAAHASRHHWSIVGSPVNFARGEWQVSRVYAVLGRPEPALHHARRCLDICRANGIGDFDLAFAYEALARASAVAGNRQGREHYLALARSAAEGIRAAEDRRILESDLDTIP